VTSHVSIASRFCGPPQSGNGGYTSGLLAELIDGPSVVTLRSPPPLDTELTLEREPSGRVLMQHAGNLVAEATATSVELELPEPVPFSVAERAAHDFVGYRSHPFPRCFVCGIERPRGDGLALYPGAVPERQLVAAPWVPTADLCDERQQVTPRFMWAALDCPSWFGFVTFADRVVPTLLGRLSAVIHRAPALEEPCVVLGWHLGTEGRRIACASAIYGANRDCIAYSQSTWVTLKP